jgi:hypothetical protein
MNRELAALWRMLTGHRTRSVLERYNIVREQDLRDAGRKLAGTIPGRVTPVLPELPEGDRLQVLDFTQGSA